MGAPAMKLGRRATYADLEAVPPTLVAEIVGGELHVMPRPAPRHANAGSELMAELRSKFGPHGPRRGGPGGWWILYEPELHFPDPAAPDDPDVVDPDIAGWRRERMPELPPTAYFTLAPDWVCEILSRSTATFDREEKMPLYAREGVKHAWLVDPIERTLEVYELGLDRWGEATVYRAGAVARIPPFEVIELDLSILWAK
jgi:Uma2 family endonuclease